MYTAIPTVKIKSDKPNGKGYRIINESDFDPKTHELFNAVEETTERFVVQGSGQKWSIIDTADSSVVKADIKKAAAKSEADELNRLNAEKIAE